MLKAALRYHKLGFSVIPCKSDKRPIVKWEPYQRQRADKQQITEWWTKYPYANIAIVTGEVSGVDVVDCDTEEAYQMLNENFLPDSFQTPVVKTPKGYHLYFKHQSGLSNQVRAINGTDLRTTGGYVIAPPSKNGNDTPYSWFTGLTPKDVNFNPMPEFMFDVLKQACLGTDNALINTNISNTSVINNYSLLYSKKTDHNNHNDHNLPQRKQELFTSGSRDNDLFHAANCLIKGGCEEHFATKILEIIAKNCEPPFSEKEIPLKIASALARKERRESSISDDVRMLVSTTNGNITTTHCHRELNLTTSNHKKAANMALLRMESEGIIEKTGKRAGEYRIIDQDTAPVDWLSAVSEYVKMWLPLGLCNLTGKDGILQVSPGDIILFAGTPNVGKTGFLMNIAKENRLNFNVHYISSELNPEKFRMRYEKDKTVSIDMLRDIKFYDLSNSRNKNFQDFIKPGNGNLNICDYVESLEEPWKMGVCIDGIFRKLNGAVAVIAIQKKPGSEMGYGGTYTTMRPSVVINLESCKKEGYNEATIIKCKQPDDRFIEEVGSPEYMKCQYNLVQGIKVIKKGVWSR